MSWSVFVSCIVASLIDCSTLWVPSASGFVWGSRHASSLAEASLEPHVNLRIIFLFGLHSMVDDYVLQVCGQRAYITGDHFVVNFSYVREWVTGLCVVPLFLMCQCDWYLSRRDRHFYMWETRECLFHCSLVQKRLYSPTHSLRATFQFSPVIGCRCLSKHRPIRLALVPVIDLDEDDPEEFSDVRLLIYSDLWLYACPFRPAWNSHMITYSTHSHVRVHFWYWACIMHWRL